jgi:acylphosphatase
MSPISDSESSQARQARRFYVSGQVQGVGYRYFARDAAEKIGLGGYVRNLLDGRVEVYAIGSRAQLDRLVADLRRGPRHAFVEDVLIEDAELFADFASNFTIELGD